uniref:probable receptor-like protein kinase At2g39360 n=1 Tax=Erigeron canadensis TaxID=72917 RepID=UPI001CB960C0|nr:probable receptor-like protein kinase At2g39360 [Erigeron canadensis]
MALVYEYMPQGMLEDHLHKAGETIPWLQSLKICIGSARGLDYLNTGTGTQHRIIHRDVKSSNILLDNNFSAKFSDFGLGKIGSTNQSVICGREAVDSKLDQYQCGLAQWAEDRIKQGKLNHIIDSRIWGKSISMRFSTMGSSTYCMSLLT